MPAFKKSGKLSGPLHGIPIAVKDQAETKGIPTSFGSIAIKGYVPKEDSTLVAKLKEAGAVILGKTTLPDFATSWFGYSSASGETKNPYDLSRDPGGSSAGTGAAVAANLAAVGIGEDTGGSIRVPASFDNLVGVRVTPGLISRKGLSPLVVFQDTAGPMGRTVKDTAIVLDAIVGYDPKDPYTAAFAIAGHKGSYTQNLDANGLKGARIGVLKEAFGSDGDPDCAEVNKVVRAAIKSIAAAGAEIVDVSLPNLMDFIIETSLYITHSRHDINAFLGRNPDFAYSSLDAIYKDGKYHKNLDLIKDIMTGPAKPEDDPDYYRKLAARDAFQRAVVNIIAGNKLDGICFPCCQVLPPTRRRTQRRPLDGSDLPDQHADRRADLAAVDLPASRLFVGRHSGWAGDGRAALSRARSVPSRLCVRASDAPSPATGRGAAAVTLSLVRRQAELRPQAAAARC